MWVFQVELRIYVTPDILSCTTKHTFQNSDKNKILQTSWEQYSTENFTHTSSCFGGEQ